ncbi:hypothetical protein Acr_00g0046960 [Actinidia rufa]|uniref:Uncharacterized protein n=1 Tax=Actinidia rufa TaxID=165716 RepID=A0A7J0DJP1_9ERIC|nr:hypothetical protein Acr_00g0046960 [Actinidia rufa]
MSDRADIGDLKSLEDSLASWIPEHLRKISYMPDKVNQLPLPPPEESPPRDKLPDQGETPRVNTYNSPSKEINTMTQDDLDHLKESYSFLVGVQTRIPEKGKTILSTRTGEVAFYEAAFPASLRFPIHPTIRMILNFYNTCPTQLSPNTRRSVISVLVIWRFYRHHLSLNEFRCLYTKFKSLGSDSGWLYFKPRPGKNVLKGSPNNVKGYKRRFFFTIRDDWEFSPSIVRVEGVLQVLRSWDTPSKHCNKLPILADIEEKRTARVFKKIDGGDNTEDIPIEETGIMGDEGKSSYLRDELCPGDHTRDDSVEYIGTINRSVRLISRLPNQVLLSILRAKIQPSFIIGSQAAPARVRVQARELWMSKRISLKKLAQKVKEAKGVSSASESTLTVKGVVIGEKRPREETSNVLLIGSWFELRTEPSSWKGFWLRSSRKRRKLARSSKQSPMPWRGLEEEMTELKKNEALAKKKVVEEYQTSKEFHEAVENSSSEYFGKGFDFCKRQLARHHPNLGIDLDGMVFDHDLLEEEKEVKEREKEENNKSKGSSFSP